MGIVVAPEEGYQQKKCKTTLSKGAWWYLPKALNAKR
jgi:hypothetical protein